MQLQRVEVVWSGGPIAGGGLGVHYFAGDVTPTDPLDVAVAYAALLAAIPPSVTIQVSGSGDVIEDTTGELVDTWTGSTPAILTGAGSPNECAAGVGACISWLTGGIVSGRRLRGRTFLVPIVASEYDAQGTLKTGTLTALEDFGDGMLAAGPLAVWHRPTSPSGTDGTSYGVVSHRIRDKVAFLSSRRD